MKFINTIDVMTEFSVDRLEINCSCERVSYDDFNREYYRVGNLVIRSCKYLHYDFEKQYENYLGVDEEYGIYHFYFSPKQKNKNVIIENLSTKYNLLRDLFDLNFWTVFNIDSEEEESGASIGDMCFHDKSNIYDVDKLKDIESYVESCKSKYCGSFHYFRKV